MDPRPGLPTTSLVGPTRYAAGLERAEPWNPNCLSIQHTASKRVRPSPSGPWVPRDQSLADFQTSPSP